MLPEVNSVILKYASKNVMMTSPKNQKDIISACAQETMKDLIDDLDGDPFGILVDESTDITLWTNGFCSMLIKMAKWMS